MIKCSGCGALLQSENVEEIGYTKDFKECVRCFRIKNYNEYKTVTKSNQEYYEIIKKINQTNDLVLIVVDILNINNELIDIIKKLNNKKLLVITKRDLLPTIYQEKILNYLQYEFVDKIIISSKNNYQLDDLLIKIKQNQTSENVYVVGFTNAGKSTLINKIIYNYTDSSDVVTTSNFPSTTIDLINIKIDETLNLIDTPGILDNGNILYYVDNKLLKKIVPKKEINPIVYQIKTNQTFLVDEILRVDVKAKNDLIFYFSEHLKIERFYKKTDKLINLKKHTISVDGKIDVVINGLGFIKVMKKCILEIYTLDNVRVYTRKSIF